MARRFPATEVNYSFFVTIYKTCPPKNVVFWRKQLFRNFSESCSGSIVDVSNKGCTNGNTCRNFPSCMIWLMLIRSLPITWEICEAVSVKIRWNWGFWIPTQNPKMLAKILFRQAKHIRKNHAIKIGARLANLMKPAPGRATMAKLSS